MPAKTKPKKPAAKAKAKKPTKQPAAKAKAKAKAKPKAPPPIAKKLPAAQQRRIDAAVGELRAHGLRYPGTAIASPWEGHKDLVVDGKTFAYLTIEGEPFKISCKLPQSSGVALMLPFCTPTPYGLGKAGWVTAQFSPDKALPVDMLKEWIDESYRAQAKKKRLAEID